MATLIINRTSEYINKLRDYGIYVDEQKIGTIADGESKEFTVPAGKHSVYTKIDWCSSPVVSVVLQDHETRNLHTGGFKNAKWLMPAGLVLIVLSFIINFFVAFTYLFFLLVPIFLILVYFITIGRKQYLTLSESKPAEPRGQTVMAPTHKH